MASVELDENKPETYTAHNTKPTFTTTPTTPHSTPRRGSPHCFPITRSLSTGSNTSAITLPAGATTTGMTTGRDPFYGTGAGSPFSPQGDDEEEWGEEEEEEEEEGEGLPRWDFS